MGDFLLNLLRLFVGTIWLAALTLTFILLAPFQLVDMFMDYMLQAQSLRI